MKIRKLSLLLLLCAGVWQANAQFMPSAQSETNIGNSLNVTKTTNDKKGNLNVIAWDGNNPSLFYYVDGTTISGTISLPAGTHMPDIVISSDGLNNNAYALIVYQIGSQLALTRYQWTGSSFGAPNTYYFSGIGSGGFTASTNIDADLYGNYAIVASLRNGSIQVYHGTNAALPGGLVTNGALPAFTGGNADVCLNYNGTSTYGPVGPTNINLTYGMNDLPTSYGEVYDHIVTQPVPFGSSTFGAQTTISPITPGILYGFPRIACPTMNKLTFNDRYYIVYCQSGGSGNNIYQYNNTGLGSNNLLLTGGVTGYPMPAINGNKNPAITYNEKQEITFTGWSNADLIPGTATVIGEKVKPAGGLVAPVFYYGVNTSAVQYADYLAFSSKYIFPNNVLASYVNSVTGNIYAKLINALASTMRNSNNNIIAVAKKSIVIYPNPATDYIYLNTEQIAPDAVMHVSATDITGRMSYSYTGKMHMLQPAVNKWFAGILPGVYYIQVSDEEGYAQSLKLVKQ